VKKTLGNVFNLWIEQTAAGLTITHVGEFQIDPGDNVIKLFQAFRVNKLECFITDMPPRIPSKARSLTKRMAAGALLG
jgi:hypothetical protein